jgi:spermidine synthase
LILRELLVLAQGVELKLALGLWGWLLWTGLGSLLGGHRASRMVAAPARLGGLLTLLGLLLPATILAIRAAPVLAHLPGGQTLPLTTGLVLMLILLAPFCLVSGFFFPYACRVLAEAGEGGTPGRVYGLETLGAALGVLLLQLFLLGRYSSLGLAEAAGMFLVLGSWLLARPGGRLAAAARLLVALLLTLALVGLPSLEGLSRSWQWPGRHLAATADSPYAFLSASREDGQVSFFANNLWQFTYPDPYSAEIQVQLALLMHPNPHRVLLLGGGPGLVPQVLKTTGVTRLTYVELDPQLLDLALGLLPAGQWAGDPRVRLVHDDARHFVAHTRERYDVILMALPEPRSAQLNRFYSREFFHLVAGKLASRGLFNFSLPGSETSLSPWRAAYLALAYQTLKRVFPAVLALPGERVQFFAASAAGVLTEDPEVLIARLQARRLPLQYVQDFYLREALAPAKVAYLRQVLDRQAPEINTDLTPGCYFYDLSLGSMQEGLPIGQVLLTLKRLPDFLPWALLGAVTLLLLLWLRRRPGPLYLYQVMVMGLGTIALEVLLLVLYQIQFGSLYRQLGLLIAAFMAGMGAGAAAAEVLVRKAVARPEWGPQYLGRRLAVWQLSLAALALLLALVLGGSLPAAVSLPPFLLQGGFVLIMAAVGFGGGGVFALSSGLWVRGPGESGVKGGRLYAADLLGSTLGTLGFSLVILPVWGIWAALVLVAALHAGAAVLLFSGSGR